MNPVPPIQGYGLGEIWCVFLSFPFLFALVILMGSPGKPRKEEPPPRPTTRERLPTLHPVRHQPVPRESPRGGDDLGLFGGDHDDHH